MNWNIYAWVQSHSRSGLYPAQLHPMQYTTLHDHRRHVHTQKTGLGKLIEELFTLKHLRTFWIELNIAAMAASRTPPPSHMPDTAFDSEVTKLSTYPMCSNSGTLLVLTRAHLWLSPAITSNTLIYQNCFLISLINCFELRLSLSPSLCSRMRRLLCILLLWPQYGKLTNLK